MLSSEVSIIFSTANRTSRPPFDRSVRCDTLLVIWAIIIFYFCFFFFFFWRTHFVWTRFRLDRYNKAYVSSRSWPPSLGCNSHLINYFLVLPLLFLPFDLFLESGESEEKRVIERKWDSC